MITCYDMLLKASKLWYQVLQSSHEHSLIQLCLSHKHSLTHLTSTHSCNFVYTHAHTQATLSNVMMPSTLTLDIVWRHHALDTHTPNAHPVIIPRFSTFPIEIFFIFGSISLYFLGGFSSFRPDGQISIRPVWKPYTRQTANYKLSP